MIRHRKMHWRLCQGYAMHLLAHRLAQCPATKSRRCIATPNALKTRKFKPSFMDFHTLPSWYNAAKCIEASAKTKQHSFRCANQSSVWQQRQTLDLSFFCVTNSHSPLELEGLGAPPLFLALRAFTGAWCFSSYSRFFPASITCKTNNGSGTLASTFVGMLRGCGFHPLNVDGWLICNTLMANVRILLYYFIRFDGD